MILDYIQNAKFYYSLGPRIAFALQKLQSRELEHLPAGRHELQGKDVMFDVVKYDTIAREKGKWEAHRRYIDVQYVVAGVELMGHAHLPTLTASTDYMPEKDATLYTGETGNIVSVSAGMFTIFFPHDAHMPGLIAGAASIPIHKIVAKVRAS